MTAQPEQRLPVTIITGFLGTGKTTLVNRILSDPDADRVAVLVNDFGAVSIDAHLLQNRDGPMVHLANGCICCASGGDLRRALRAVLEARPAPRSVVIETTGLADPRPVASSLESADRLALAGVVTLIDAENFDRNLELAEAAYSQITSADLLLLNKTDLASPSTLPLMHEGLRHLNVDAPILDCVNANAPLHLGTMPRSSHSAAAEHAHEHPFESTTIEVRHDLGRTEFDAWAAALPAEIIRAKGILKFDGEACIFQRVGLRNTLTRTDLASGAGQLTLIGQPGGFVRPCGEQIGRERFS
ncbi:MAG: GTP-binding protein [Chloroflexi bacterium]|nr:GTP-binding protein [Chloroflexota bacterium]